MNTINSSHIIQLKIRTYLRATQLKIEKTVTRVCILMAGCWEMLLIRYGKLDAVINWHEAAKSMEQMSVSVENGNI